MCFALYIATETAYPTEQWSEEKLQFYLQDLSDNELTVREKFSLLHVYYAGSWRGCGCGWFIDEESPATQEQRQDNRRTRDDMRQLHALLQSELRAGYPVELFLCWDGHHDDPPRRRRTLPVDDFMADSLPMEELDFVTVQNSS